MTRRIHNRSLREDEIQNHPMLAHPSSLLLPCAYDLIGYRPELFKQYVNDLFLALGGDVDNKKQFEGLKTIEKLADFADTNFKNTQRRLGEKFGEPAESFAEFPTPNMVGPVVVAESAKRLYMIYAQTARVENDLVVSFAKRNFDYSADRDSEPIDGKPFVDPTKFRPTTSEVFRLYLPIVKKWKR
jgi:hypothetical protein